MKIVGYYIFAVVFYIAKLFPRKQNRVFCIMTHDSSDEGNVGVVASALKNTDETYDFCYLKKSDKAFNNKLNCIVDFFIKKPYELATSTYIIQDNVFLPMAFLRFSKKVKVIQLWHGTGTIKKFGQTVNTGKLKELEWKANQTITHLIVNSEYTKKQYAEAFGVCEDKVYDVGLPRTDLFFNQEMCQKKKEDFFRLYPALRGKKLFLYAPTFRDHEANNPTLHLNCEDFCNKMSEECIVLLKMHPFVSNAFEKSGQLTENTRVINVSKYSDINTLLLVSDWLITDYSSIIFEYCLQEKPMLFYAYDLEEFSEEGRGFYENYEEFVPGKVTRTTTECITVIQKDEFDVQKVRDFINKNYKHLDGKATNRVLELMLETV